jgi:myosin heavy subunit
MPNFPNRCQHLKVNGTQCGSPALRRNRFCYLHKLHQEERIELNLDRLKNARRRSVMVDLPVLEDANSIQVTLMQIMRLIITGQIDGKNAGLLLYALQTASANLARTSFQPRMHDVVLDVKALHETPLSAHIWEDSDFASAEADEEDEATTRMRVMEEAQRRARKKEAFNKWAEAEADRIAEEGRSEREAQRQANMLKARQEADRQQAIERTGTIAPKDASPAAVVTPAGRAILSPSQPQQNQGKRPPANATMGEVREKVTAQIRKALPGIAAAVRENGDRSG